MEHPTKEYAGVYMFRKNLRQAMRHENPHIEQASVNACVNAGQQNCVYTNSPILDSPVQAGRDDVELVCDACKKMLEIVIAGDAYERAERDSFIHNAMKEHEQSYAKAVAAA
jgi:hypothetical protein